MKTTVFTDVAHFFNFPPVGINSEVTKLIWLVRLRWAAIALFFLMAGPTYMLGALDRPRIVIFVGILGFLFLFNLLTQLIFTESKRHITPLFICLQMTIDLTALSSLLLFSGGFANPFVGLFLLNAALGGVLIRGKYSWPFIGLSHAFLIILQLRFLQEHEYDFSREPIIFVVVSHILLFSIWLIMRACPRSS